MLEDRVIVSFNAWPSQKIHGVAKEQFQVIREAKEFQSRCLARFECHQQIHVAVWPCRPLRTGAEQLQLGDVVASAELGEALLVDVESKGHGAMLASPPPR